ncbi:uncharacterized protein M8220_015518 [Acridotheres tristis]
MREELMKHKRRHVQQQHFFRKAVQGCCIRLTSTILEGKSVILHHELTKNAMRWIKCYSDDVRSAFTTVSDAFTPLPDVRCKLGYLPWLSQFGRVTQNAVAMLFKRWTEAFSLIQLFPSFSPPRTVATEI